MKKLTIVKLSVGSVAKTVGVLQAVFAFVVGLFDTPTLFRPWQVIDM